MARARSCGAPRSGGALSCLSHIDDALHDAHDDASHTPVCAHCCDVGDAAAVVSHKSLMQNASPTGHRHSQRQDQHRRQRSNASAIIFTKLSPTNFVLRAKLIREFFCEVRLTENSIPALLQQTRVADNLSLAKPSTQCVADGTSPLTVSGSAPSTAHYCLYDHLHKTLADKLCFTG